MLKFERNWLAIFLMAAAVSACGSKNHSSGGDSKPAPANRVNWSSIPADYHPSTEDIQFLTAGYEKLNIDAFGFNNDVEIVYTPNVSSGTGFVRLYKVWAKSASWGDVRPRANGKTLEVRSSGSYECSIQISDGSITSLEGGCYIRMQIYLPVGSEVEVYNLDQLISKRFIPIDAITFLDQLKRATWADDKFAVIENYLASYSGLNKTPALTAYQLGEVINEFNRGEEKLKALSRLHTVVTDRQNLAAMIDDKFSYFDRDEARKIVGL